MAGDYNFPDIEFVSTETEAIVNELTAAYEEEFERTLYPADPIRLLILWFASILSQERSFMNIAAKRNLPRYAEGEYLDSLAEIFFNTYRAQAIPAKTTLQFTLSSEQPEPTTIPTDTLVTADGAIFFSTIEDLTIPSGELTGTVDAECTTEGSVGNSYSAGQINRMVNQLAFIAEVTNVTQSAGGSGIETDEELYGRLRESYDGYSTAGTSGAYRYHAMKHNSAVEDVLVYELDPGQTGVIILMESGMPTPEEIEDMKDFLSSDDIRPITDQVFVSAPTQVPFSIELEYFGAARPEPGGKELHELVEQATAEYIEWQTQKIGRRINPAKLISSIMQLGAGRVEITSPVGRKLEPTECAVLSGEPILRYGGEDE